MNAPERLLMRGWRLDDLGDWARICSDAEAMLVLGEDGPLDTVESWNRMISLAGQWQLQGFGQWALEERSSGALVGRTGFFRPPDWPGIEVGWLVDRARWGEGIAGEAARSALRWGHDELGVDHVISLILEDNTRSRRVAEKLGQTVEGSTHLRGHDLLIYGADLPLAG